MSLDIEVYVIRHVPSGKYLPARKNRRGFSNDEPEENGGKLGPRVFVTYSSACKALTAWLMGIHVAKRDSGRMGRGLFAEVDDDYEEWVEVVPQPHRKRAEMEIVPCRLSEEP